MANDRLGNAIVAGQIFALAGTVRSIDGDSILIVVGDRGEHAFRCRAGHIVKVDDTTAGGGGGAPTDATYIVASASGGLSAERVLTNSAYIVWDLSTPGQVTAAIDPGVFVYLSAIFAPIAHAHAASDITSGTIATARLGSGTASSTTFLRGDQAYSTIPTGAIDDDAITDAKLRNSAALSIIGRSSNSSGDPADIVNTTDHQVMRRSGTSIGWGAVNLAQSAAVTGALPIANGGTGSTSASAARTALGVAATSHDHEARFVFVDTSDFAGYLAGAAGAGTMSVQELFEYIDANGLTPP